MTLLKASWLNTKEVYNDEKLFMTEENAWFVYTVQLYCILYLTLSILIPEYRYYKPWAVLKEYCIISPYI